MAPLAQLGLGLALLALMTSATMGHPRGSPKMGQFLQGSTNHQVICKGQLELVRRDRGQYEACQRRLRNWTVWEGGLTGTVVIKDAGDPPLTSWSVILQVDRDVDDFRSYDSQVQQLNRRTFIMTPFTWNAEVAEVAEGSVSIQMAWAQGGPEPHVASLSINGETFTCMDLDDVQEPDGSPDDTTEEAPTTTSSGPDPAPPGDRGIFVPWPKRVMGFYILLADDSEPGFETGAEWQPRLHPYMQKGSNVLFFTFIDPATMEVPLAFRNLAATRGTDQPGAVPKDTVILFAIGGYAYSISVNPWPWLESKEAAEAMADKVAKWPETYGCDGIDLDIEEGAGSRVEAGPNLVHFVRRLRQLQPKIIVGQPTYGYPAVNAEIDVINASWDEKGNSKDLADEIGLMVYEGTESLSYVKNYVNGADQWDGFPIKVNAPSNTILLGAKGSTEAANINTLVDETLKNNYRGIMVWYASVVDGLQYEQGSWDASTVEATQKAYVEGLAKFRKE